MANRSRDEILRDKARANGAHYALVIIRAARSAGIKISLGFALIEQESNFRNVWGGDPVPNGHTSSLHRKKVQKNRYLEYTRARDRGGKGRGGMQGVGPAQLTYYSFQDRADAKGGCWIARHNIAVAFETLAGLIDRYGERKALAVYNGGASNPQYDYAQSVLQRQNRWHRILS